MVGMKVLADFLEYIGPFFRLMILMGMDTALLPPGCVSKKGKNCLESDPCICHFLTKGHKLFSTMNTNQKLELPCDQTKLAGLRLGGQQNIQLRDASAIARLTFESIQGNHWTPS